MMHTRSTSLSRHMLAACALGALMASPASFAASGTGGNTDIQAQYRIDVQRCKTGQTNQDEATCLREAGAALEEARRNRLLHANPAYDQNQRARCQALPAGERDACMMQMSGQNTTFQGSIAGGGVLRETTITVPADSTTSTGSGVVPSGSNLPNTAPVSPAPGLTPNPPALVPAPSLTPGPTTTTPVPGTGMGTGIR